MWELTCWQEWFSPSATRSIRNMYNSSSVERRSNVCIALYYESALPSTGSILKNQMLKNKRTAIWWCNVCPLNCDCFLCVSRFVWELGMGWRRAGHMCAVRMSAMQKNNQQGWEEKSRCSLNGLRESAINTICIHQPLFSAHKHEVKYRWNRMKYSIEEMAKSVWMDQIVKMNVELHFFRLNVEHLREFHVLASIAKAIIHPWTRTFHLNQFLDINSRAP